jgi:hypothetical protein
VFANSTEITQCNQKAQDHPRGRTVLFYWLSGYCGVLQNNPYIPRPLNRLGRRLYHSYGKKKKHTHGKESVHYKSEGDDNPQIQAQTDKEVGMKHDYKV